MPQRPLHPRDVGIYVALAQVGLEMVAPLGLGIALDYYWQWSPWSTVVGAVLGLVLGIAHLAILANQHNDNGAASGPRRKT